MKFCIAEKLLARLVSFSVRNQTDELGIHCPAVALLPRVLEALGSILHIHKEKEQVLTAH